MGSALSALPQPRAEMMPQTMAGPPAGMSRIPTPAGVSGAFHVPWRTGASCPARLSWFWLWSGRPADRGGLQSQTRAEPVGGVSELASRQCSCAARSVCGCMYVSSAAYSFSEIPGELSV